MFGRKLRTFPSNNEGNVALIFAVALPVVVGTAGGAIDLARASKMRTALSQAVDAAASRIELTQLSCPAAAKVISYNVSDCTTKSGERISALASRLVTAEFQNAGFDTKLDIDPAVTVNPANSRVIVRASSNYACTLFKLLSPSCDVSVGSDPAPAADRVASSDALRLQTPTPGEIWLGETGSPALPSRINATGGTAPYKYAVGPNLPDGLKLDGQTGLISGRPTPVACELECPPQMRKIAVSAFDSTAPARRTATGVITYTVIHPLRLEIKPAKTGQAAIPQVVRTGGKPPFQYLCTSAVTNVFCHPTTGQIVRFSGPGGEIMISVTDARGISETKKANISP